MYQYHVQTFAQVNDTDTYCLPGNPPSEEDSKINNWKCILGCYTGNNRRTVVGDRHNATWMALEVSNISDPNQCTLEYESVLPDPTPNPTPMPTDSLSALGISDLTLLSSNLMIWSSWTTGRLRPSILTVLIKILHPCHGGTLPIFPIILV